MKNNKLVFKLPVAIGGIIWDIDFPERPFVVTGYRIGRMMGEDIEDFDEDYEGRENELHVQYECCEISGSMPVSSMGKTFFLTREDLLNATDSLN